VVTHQKGANGLIAEYQCALEINNLLRNHGFNIDSDSTKLRSNLESAISRVGNELEDLEVRRALSQGRSLAEHITKALVESPGDLGLLDLTPDNLRQAKTHITTIGHDTDSGTSADISLRFSWSDANVRDLPISLKAYGARDVSLGSKSAKAALARMFMGKPRVSDLEFIEFFGEPAKEFVSLLSDFKSAAREFYSSPQGAAFVKSYQTRKGLPSTAKVNNPNRRKEVGDYFIASRGYRPEHEFARLYTKMFNDGFAKISGDDAKIRKFVEALRFVIGMEEGILTLNAIADNDSEVVRRVENSLLSDSYGQIQRLLKPGVQVSHHQRDGSSTMGVSLRLGEYTSNDLSLAVWKEATIQYKMASGGNDEANS